MIHAILNPLTKSDIIVYQIDCQFIKERNLLPVFPERQHSIMTAHDNQILSRIGNGLEGDELMPVEYEYRDSGYSLTAVKRKIGRGAIFCTSLLIGTKLGHEPVADILLNNLLSKE